MKQRDFLLLCKKSFLFFFFVLLFSALVHAQTFTYTDNWGAQGISIERETPTNVLINFSVPQFQLDDVEVDGINLKAVHLPGVFLPNNAGYPDLPGMGRYIAIPQGSEASFRIISMRTEVLQNIDVAPAPRIPKDTETGPLEYNKNPQVYSSSKYYPESPVLLSEKSQIRGVDAVILGITPFQYNPATKELLVYKDIKVEVTFNGGNGKFGDNRLRSLWWDPILRDALLNYSTLPVINYTNRNISDKLTEDFEYIIVTPDNPQFLPWADSIKNFRLKQGIRAGVVTLTQIGGNTTTAIETYVNNAYNTWDIPPVAVLLMADYGTGAATGNGIISPIWNSYCKSDHLYADVNNDNMADIIFARMTAQNSAHLQTMVNKFLGYERNPPTNPNFYDKPVTAMGWQTERWFQLCSEIVNGFWEHHLGKHPVRENAIYSGTPGTSWSSNQNTSMIVNYFGPTGTQYIPATPSHLTDWGGNATRVNNDINSGAFMLQHRDHGAENGWGEPAYNNSNIVPLNNNDLVFVLSINCLTGKFDYSSECFAEAFHRHQKGALGLIAATEVSYSFVNDTYVWGMFDNFWPEFMPSYGQAGPVKVLPAFGNSAGKYFLQASNWPYNTGDKMVTYYLFHHHGDAFSTVYSEMPQNLNVVHNPVLISGQTTFTVNADIYSLIGLTVDGELIASAEGTGAPVNITIPVLLPGQNLLVTVTKQNYYRYSVEVPIIPPAGAYVVHESCSLNDNTGNNNGLLDYGETVSLNLCLKNVGTQNAAGVTAKIRSTDEFITLIDTTETYGAIPAGGTVTIPNGFSFSVAGTVPDEHNCNFTIVATDGSSEWTSYFTVRAHAPNLEFTGFTLADPLGNNNGKLDPGETATLTIGLKNSGTSEALNVIGTLVTADPYITINTNNLLFGTVDTNATVTKDFSVAASASTPTGHNVNFDINFAGNLGITGTGAFHVVVGQIPVLILDLDPNQSSSPKMQEAIQNCDITSETLTSFPADLSIYSSIFVCLGIYSNNHVLSASEGQLLADYLTAGGRLFMEGGDTWYYDDQTAVHPMFKIQGTADGSGDLTTVQGQANSLGAGMTFSYNGENSYIDRLTAIAPAIVAFKNPTVNYACGISYNAGTYKTFGTSFEFGGLVNGASPSLRDSVMGRILTFFDLMGVPVELVSFSADMKEASITLTWETATETNNSGFDIQRSSDGKTFTSIGNIKGNGTTTEKQRYSFTDNQLTGSGTMYYRLKQVDYNGTYAYSEVLDVEYSAIPLEFSLSQNYPNPFNPETTIKFALPKNADVTLKVYDALGSEVETIVSQQLEPGYYTYKWNSSKYASGMYIYHIQAGEFTAVKKMMVLK